MIAFDVGANRGKTIDDLLTKGYTRIIAIEANKKLGALLKQKYFNDNRVRVIEKVVCEHENGKKFYISSADTISTSSTLWMTRSRFKNHYPVTWGAPIVLESTTLDKIIQLYGAPDFIKIDVEGGEVAVFRGLSKCNAKIAFEWTEELFDDIVEKCVEKLKTLGYTKFTYQIGDSLADEPKESAYTAWEKCGIHDIVDRLDYYKWGNIWAKKSV